MFRAQIREEISKIVGDDLAFSVERSDSQEHGDYSSNVALALAKKEQRNPKEVAKSLKTQLGDLVAKLAEKIEIAGPGFLNFWIKKEALFEKLSFKISLTPSRKMSGSYSAMARPRLEILSESFSIKPQKINIEFVSANPTGPLTMANGRGGFYGDVLANILEAVGHEVTREYYINDAGNQIKLLGESILAAEGKMPEKEEYYKGDYIKKLKGKTAKQVAVILLKEIKISLKKAGIKFDVWFSEDKNIHKTGALKKTLEFLVKNKFVKEKEGALWLDDAVIIKSDKEPTYFLADLAYHYDKFIKRKFDVCINVWGADHHGYVERMKNGVRAFGIDSKRLQIIVMQMVRLVSKGKEIKMSKRAGEFVTLDELIKMAGLDAARWFFLERSPNTHMDFDLDLAKERSKKNPVYYVQYAHARACSILRKVGNVKWGVGNVKFLTSHLASFISQPEELALIKKILQLPEIIEDISNDYQVHRLPRYAYELAQVFTNFYEKHHVIDEKNPELTQARLFLVRCTLNAIHYTLNLMGIASPERM